MGNWYSRRRTVPLTFRNGAYEAGLGDINAALVESRQSIARRTHAGHGVVPLIYTGLSAVTVAVKDRSVSRI